MCPEPSLRLLMPAWRILARPEDFDRYRGDEAFAEVLTLGRVTNLLRAVLSLSLDAGDRDGSAAYRARTSTTLLLTGLLVEAIMVVKRSGRHFRHLPAHLTHIQPLFRDPEIDRLEREWLRPMRHQAAFHNDEHVSLEGFRAMHPAVPQPIAQGDSEDAFATH